MTQEEQDLLIGRVMRESKEAEANLQRLLVKAEQVAAEIKSLAAKVLGRVQSAKLAGSTVRGTGLPYTASDGGFEAGALEQYSEAVDLTALRALDVEIGQAVGKALKLREQKQQLGL